VLGIIPADIEIVDLSGFELVPFRLKQFEHAFAACEPGFPVLDHFGDGLDMLGGHKSPPVITLQRQANDIEKKVRWRPITATKGASFIMSAVRDHMNRQKPNAAR
jgi:hypothetical protein